MNVTKRLQHFAQHSKMTSVGTPENSGWGDKPNVATSINTIACFAYQDDEELLREGNIQTGKRRWTVLAAKNATDIAEGDRITNITTKQNEVVCSGGQVIDILVITHYLRGVECRQVIVDPN